ncbi:MAG: GntR family transcriptional regulator [Rhodocyclaceae bacterium]
MDRTLAAGGIVGLSPLYKRVAERILRGLASGEWVPGEPIPSETKLAQRFDVSIGTVRKAIDELVAGQILVRHQGRGTFVAVHNEDRALFYFFRIVGKDGVKTYPTSEILSFSRGRAEPGECAALHIARGAAVLRFRNRLSIGGRALILDRIAVPRELFPDLDEATLRGRESTIYSLYQRRYGINVIRARERLRARACPPETARALKLAEGTPILEIRRIAYTYDDTPVEYRVSQVDTRRHDYLNDLGSDAPASGR